MSAPRPITMLIAALGGEGGGVLTDWIVAAADEPGLSGAEHVDPRRRPAHRRHDLLHRDLAGAVRASSAAGGRCMALAPGIGDVDIVRGERAAGGRRAPSRDGFVTPDRTLADRLDAPLLRDGRKDRDGRRPLRRRQARRGDRRECAGARCCSTWTHVAQRSGAMINAVMLGAIAGIGRLPIPAEAFEAAIRGRRQGRRGQSARLSRRARSRARGRAAGATSADNRARGRDLADLEADGGARCRQRRARSSPRAAPARGLSGRGLCAALSRPAAADRRGRRARRRRRPACCARPRGISRCACPTRT